MRKIIYILLAGLFMFSSCVKRDAVSVDSFDNAEMVSMSKLNLTFTVSNSSRKKIALDNGRMVLMKDGFELGQVIMSEEVTIPKKFNGQVVLPLRLKLTDVFGMMSLARNLDKPTLDSVLVTGCVRVKAGALGKNIEFKDTPLSKILTTFGVKPEGIKIPI